MSAIMRRELSAYFTSPIGYIFLSVFYIFAGFFFFTGTLVSSSTDMTGVFSGLSTITDVYKRQQYGTAPPCFVTQIQAENLASAVIEQVNICE